MVRKLILTGVSALLLFSCGHSEKAEKLEFKTVKGISIQTVEPSYVKDYDSFSGVVIPSDQIIISPKVPGYLLKIKVKAGDNVKKGETVAVIDKKALTPDVKRALAAIKEAEAGLKEIENALEEVKAKKQAAEASFNLAEKTFNRFKNLLKEDAVSKQKFDEVKAQYEMAKANLKAVEAKERQLKAKEKQLLAKKEQAKAMLEKAKAYVSFTYLKSPVDGVVLQKLTDEGNLVSPGVGILKVGTFPLQVKALIDSEYADKLKVGDSLTTIINNESFPSTVVEIDKDADPISHKFAIKLKLKNYKNVIPGMYATVLIPQKKEQKILIPQSAIYRVGALEYVYVIDKNNVAHLRYVKTGRKIDGKVEIISGLRPGDRIAVTGIENLCDGAKVER